MSRQFIVTGIGTDIGKTVVSAILSQVLEATYWKPVQAGELESTDSIKVKNWCTEAVQILPEAFRLQHPMSPHAAAEKENINITSDQLSLPEIKGNLIIEGAGGLMVPLNNEGLLFIDQAEKWNLPVILVSRHYLGSINHTLLSAEVLRTRKIEIAGIVFVGDENKATEEIILTKTKLNCIARIPITDEVNSEFIQQQARRIVSKSFFNSFTTV